MKVSGRAIDGWSILTRSLREPIDTSSTGRKTTWECRDRNKTVTRLNITAYSVSTTIQIDILKNGISILGSLATIAAGNTVHTGGLISNNVWNIGEKLDVWVIGGAGTEVKVAIETDEDEYEVVLQRLSSPVITNITPGATQIAFTFTKDALATSHEIEWKTGAGAYTPVSGYNGTDLTYTHSGRTENTQYDYRIRSLANGYENSEYTPLSVSTDISVNSQSDMIAALPGLWAFIKCYDIASPLVDSSVNNRSFTAINGTLRSVAIETSDINDFSFKANNTTGGILYRNEAFLTNQSFGIHKLIKFYGGIASNRWHLTIRNSSGNPTIFLGVGETDSSRLRVRCVNNSSSAIVEASSATGALSLNTTYLVSLRYNHATTTLDVLKNGVVAITVSVNLGVLTGHDIIVIGSSSTTGNTNNADYQKIFIVVGQDTTDQKLAEIYNEGTY